MALFLFGGSIAGSRGQWLDKLRVVSVRSAPSAWKSESCAKGETPAVRLIPWIYPIMKIFQGILYAIFHKILTWGFFGIFFYMGECNWKFQLFFWFINVLYYSKSIIFLKRYNLKFQKKKKRITRWYLEFRLFSNFQILTKTFLCL